MKKHIAGMLTALVLAGAMLLQGCITIVAPTKTPESAGPETVTTKAEQPTTEKPKDTQAPTQKPDTPETQQPTTEEPKTEPPTEKPTEPPTEKPTEPAGPPTAKTFESLPVLVSSHSKKDWDSSINRNKFVVEWPQFTVLGQDWPALAKALETWNALADKSGTNLFNDNLADARKGFDPNMNNWEERTSARIQRADEKIFSVFMEHETYRGGAHPTTSNSALNLDPKTGKTLSLSDIVRDADVFTKKTLDLLEKQNKENGSPFGSNYKETFKGLLQKEMNGEDAVGIAWFLLEDHLRIVINEYLIASYAYGPVYVDVPFYDDGTLYLDGSYFTKTEGLFWSFTRDAKNNYNTYLLEETPMGKRIISVISYPGEWYGQYEFCVGELMSKRDCGLGLTNVYMYAKDGKYHSYVEYTYENEYQNIDTYEVSTNDFAFMETIAGKIVFVKSDSDHLLLRKNNDALGTWTGYAKLRIQADGTLRPEGPYMFDNKGDSFYGDSPRTLTTKREVKAFSVKDPSKEVKIPAGTVLVPYETNFTDFLDVVLPDGSLARIKYVLDKANYTYLIDGVDQYDVFDGIMYAG